jgi:hypothetical protein
VERLLPAGHVLNAMSSAIFTGFQKRFKKEGNKFTGITSDTDGRINARNSLEELNLTQKTGDLEPGRYIKLNYLDPPWQGFYDIFKVINKDLLIGHVYLGTYPNGLRMFTFPMTRVYGFNNMKVEDHRRIWEKAVVPTKQELNGIWRMDVISNANQASGLANLAFDLKPDGRLESRYLLLGLIEGLVMPSFAANHFQLTDFTPFHDEIRKIDKDLMVGKYVTELPVEAANLPPFGSLGIFHQEQIPGENRPRFGFYYILTRTDLSAPADQLAAASAARCASPRRSRPRVRRRDGWLVFPRSAHAGGGRPRERSHHCRSDPARRLSGELNRVPLQSHHAGRRYQ